VSNLIYLAGISIMLFWLLAFFPLFIFFSIVAGVFLVAALMF